MPDYDEYGMAYKDRSALAHPDHRYWSPPWNRFVVVDGVISGSWLRTLRPDAVTLEVSMFDLPWGRRTGRRRGARVCAVPRSRALPPGGYGRRVTEPTKALRTTARQFLDALDPWRAARRCRRRGRGPEDVDLPPRSAAGGRVATSATPPASGLDDCRPDVERHGGRSAPVRS